MTPDQFLRMQSTLAAHVAVVKHESVVSANAAVNAVNRKLGTIWREIEKAVSEGTPGNWLNPAKRVRELLYQLLPAAVEAVEGTLASQFERSQNKTRKAILRTLPVEYLKELAPTEIRESIGIQIGPGGVGSVTNALAGIDQLPEPQQRQAIQQVLFPPQSRQDILATLRTADSQESDWRQRFRIPQNPDQLTQDIATGMSRGENRTELLKRVQPHVNGVRWQAERIARTEGIRVAQAATEKQFEALGDLIAGYQIRAVLDLVTEPAHAARNGLVWMKDSGVPMRQALRMKRDTLPDRPNCRCFLIPVMRPPTTITKQQAETLRNTPPPAPGNHQVYSQWFAKANEQERRVAVGSKRYDEVLAKLNGKRPRWHDFIDPSTGDLIDRALLQAESPQALLARRAANIQAEQVQKAAIKTIRATGTNQLPKPQRANAAITQANSLSVFNRSSQGFLTSQSINAMTRAIAVMVAAEDIAAIERALEIARERLGKLQPGTPDWAQMAEQVVTLQDQLAKARVSV